MNTSDPVRKVYNASDKDIPPGFYKLRQRVTKGDTAARSAPAKVEVNAQRAFRPHDGTGTWQSLDRAEYANSQLKGPYKVTRS